MYTDISTIIAVSACLLEHAIYVCKFVFNCSFKDLFLPLFYSH